MMKQNMRLLFIASLSIYGLETSDAFQTHRRVSTPSKIFVDTDPLREMDVDIDLEIAEDCANNFGKYSFEEIEQCRDELHTRRVQNVALGEGKTPDFMKELFLEEELNLQLKWLKNEMPESYLFPVEETFDLDNIDTTNKEINGVLMDNGLIAVDLPDLQTSEATGDAMVPRKNVFLDELAKEGALESVAICVFLGLVLLAPDLF